MVKCSKSARKSFLFKTMSLEEHSLDFKEGNDIRKLLLDVSRKIIACHLFFE
jgi:hypothetical protein